MGKEKILSHNAFKISKETELEGTGRSYPRTYMYYVKDSNPEEEIFQYESSLYNESVELG